MLNRVGRIPAQVRGSQGPHVQALVYLFIALAAAGLGATAYFGLTFTPAEAILVAIVVGCVFVVLMERVLRERAERRLERAIEDLSRLLSTDAQAGAVLGQRINVLADLNPGQRLETAEADISVLGTVIRQVAEAVADIEDKVAKTPNYRPHYVPERASPVAAAAAPAPSVNKTAEPVIPLTALRQAISENRLVYHVQPVVRLPQRRPAAYDLIPRLMLEDGEMADAGDFMPRRAGQDVVREIEGAGLAEAIGIARRARTGGMQVNINVPLSRTSLGNDAAAEQLLVTLDANRAVAPSLNFIVQESEWHALTTVERAMLESIVRKGAGFSLDDVQTLRFDIADLAAMGVRSLRVDAERFISDTESFTDFHISDIASYLARFEMLLLATGVANERQIVELLDNEILLVQGSYVAPPGPVRPELSLEPARSAAPQLRHAES